MADLPLARHRLAVQARLRAAGCVFAEDEAEVLLSAAGSPDDLAAMVERRASGEPLEYVVGWAEFHGLRIAVDPGVFVPRRRTGLLVDEAVAAAGRIRQGRQGRQGRHGRPLVAVDLCCGSGAVAVALLAALADLGPGIEVHAADLDPAAVSCARRNVEPAGGRVHEGDLYEALPAGLRGQVDLLVANAPYVPTGEVAFMPPEAREYEHRVALDGGADGLDVPRRVVGGAPRWLAPDGGHLFVESSRRQAARLVEAAQQAGLAARVARSAERDATAVVAVLGARLLDPARPARDIAI